MDKVIWLFVGLSFIAGLQTGKGCQRNKCYSSVREAGIKRNAFEMGYSAGYTSGVNDTIFSDSLYVEGMNRAFQKIK